MKYAAAIRYGGQLVEAAEVDYESYKALGLLCPNCKEPVFLQGASRRLTRDKVVQVPCHFKHFAAKDPALVKQCEARVAKYDQSEVQRRATIARNQRLKLLQRWFWTIFSKYSSSEVDVHLQWYKQSVSEKNRNAFEEESSFAFIKNVGFLKSIADYFIKNITEDCERYIQYLMQERVSGVSADAVQKDIALIRRASSLDLELQRLVVHEILDFLCTSSSRSLLKQLLIISLSILNSEIHFKNSPDFTSRFAQKPDNTYKWCSKIFVTRTCAIPWLDEFANLKQ